MLNVLAVVIILALLGADLYVNSACAYYPAPEADYDYR